MEHPRFGLQRLGHGRTGGLACVLIAMILAACVSSSRPDHESTDDASFPDPMRLDDAGPGAASELDALDSTRGPIGDVAKNDDVVEHDTMLSDSKEAGAEDGDAPTCACVDFEADSLSPSVTTSLDCFGTIWRYDYETLMNNPCIGLDPIFAGASNIGQRYVDTYPEWNLVGVRVSVNDAPVYEWFYDASSKVLVGASRSNSWFGGDPIYCKQPDGLQGRGHYIIVQAGRVPFCDDPGLGNLCRPASGQQICPPPEASSPEASFPEASSPEASSRDASPSLD